MKQLVYLKERELDGSSTLIIKWRLFTQCNFNCSYCIAASMNRRTDYDPEVLTDKEESLCKAARDLSTVLDTVYTDIARVQLELIGGEVTLINLKNILNNIKTNKLWRVQITTNFSRTVAYYIDLADYLASRNIEFSLSCSWHYAYTSLSDYIARLAQVKPHCRILIAEMVSTSTSQDYIPEFTQSCKHLGIPYKVDIDSRTRKGYVNRSNLKCTVYRNTGKPRYIAKLKDKDTGEIEIRTIAGRADLANQPDIEQFVDRYWASVGGYLCSVSLNYLYIDGTTARPNCHKSCEISELMRDRELITCSSTRCSLCGRMSLYLNEEEFKEALSE